ncbi:phosphotransferase family protein [Streptomyces corynorhini]|uniref:phosphotransferase family protein n=1 Tax=Streptomyces corynorhini TaxID=2282652 RepID=UPI002D796EE3|nr:phosphotransferase [Streptomyces corynorhini]
MALTLNTVQDGLLFLKGVRDSDADGTAALRWEQLVSPAVAGVAPDIRHAFHAYGWSCLAFTYVQGRNADLGPGTADLAAVAEALERLGELAPPDIQLPPLTNRLADYLRPGEADTLAGEHLLHTDTNPHNIMIDSRGTAHVVDWAMPAVGPAWVDPAYTAVRLMEYGQPPDAALAWLDRFASWRHAEPKAVEAFVSATCRQWTDTVGERGSLASNARFRHLSK